jgi:hypothetical protein
LAVRNEALYKKRNLTPALSTFGIKGMDEWISKKLKSLRVVFETFLKSPELPTWDPPDYATPRDRESLAKLQSFKYQLIAMATQAFYFIISMPAMVMKLRRYLEIFDPCT